MNYFAAREVVPYVSKTNIFRNGFYFFVFSLYPFSSNWANTFNTLFINS